MRLHGISNLLRSESREVMGGGGVGEVLPLMAYTERLHLKGMSFQGFRYVKGKGFYNLKHMEWNGTLSLHSVNRPKRANNALSGCEKVEETLWFFD